VYIKLAWGSAEEQEAGRRAGNPDAKNWQDEARKILEDMVRHFLLSYSTPLTCFDILDGMILEGSTNGSDSLALLSSRGEDEGWQAELRRYLKDLPADVTKDTDIVKWWQVCDSMLCSTNQIITIYRTTGTLTPLFNVSPSITFLAKHHLSHASVFSPLVVKSQQSAVLN
jgi:hypothetical protein